MPDATEQRQFRRYPIQLPLLHTSRTPTRNGRGVGWSRDLSEGGGCVELAEHLSSQTPLRVRLRTDLGVIETEAKVAWAGDQLLPGGGILHGLAYTYLAPDQLQALQDLLLYKGLVRPAKIRFPFEVAVTCHSKKQAGPPLQGMTRDMSRGGLLLRLPRVVPSGTVLEITLHIPAGPLKAEGAVIWVAPPEGRTPGGPIRHGLRFTAIDWTSLLAIGSFLTQSSQGSPSLLRDRREREIPLPSSGPSIP